MPTVEFSEKFLKFLEDTPEMLIKFIDIANEFYKIQGEAPQPVREEDGPRDWQAGETHDLTTIGISHEDLDAMAQGYAKAVVKEKAIAYLKGFVAGVMIAI